MGRILWGLALLVWLVPFVWIVRWSIESRDVQGPNGAEAMLALGVGALMGLALCTAITALWWALRARAGVWPILASVAGAPLAVILVVVLAYAFAFLGEAAFVGVVGLAVVGAYALNLRLLLIAP